MDGDAILAQIARLIAVPRRGRSAHYVLGQIQGALDATCPAREFEDVRRIVDAEWLSAARRAIAGDVIRACVGCQMLADADERMATHGAEIAPGLCAEHASPGDTRSVYAAPLADLVGRAIAAQREGR